MKLITIKQVIFLLAVCSSSLVQAADPDVVKDFQSLVESHGFTLEAYTVTTEDRYVNIIHRVVPKQYNPETYSKTRKPVIAFHGVLCQSPIYYMNSPFLTASDSQCGDNFGFGMVLSEKYDLWVPNARGNGISMGHLDYNPSDLDFWEFDWDQIAYYDIPAFVHFVRNHTKHNSVGYVGYSQGGATALALLSRRPEFSEYIQPLITWAPAAFLGQATSIAKAPLVVGYPLIQAIPGQFLISSQGWLNTLGATLCPLWLLNGVCKALLDGVLGQSNSINATRIPVYMHFFPSSGSNWQAGHFGQQFAKGRFARFDYLNSQTNGQKYGQITPPDYPLANIPKNVTIVVMYGHTDAVVDYKDNQHLVSILQGYNNPVIDYPINKTDQIWSHFDFVTGQSAGKYVYDPTIDFLDQYVIQDGPQ